MTDERRLVTFNCISARSGSTRTRTVKPHYLRLAEGARYLDAVEPTGAHRSDASRQPEEMGGTAVGLRASRLAYIAGSVTAHGSSETFARLPAKEPSHRCVLLATPLGRALRLCLVGAHFNPVQTLWAELPALSAHLEGRNLIAVEYEDPFSFAGIVTTLGDVVIVLVPDSLCQTVLPHLQGTVGLAAPEGE